MRIQRKSDKTREMEDLMVLPRPRKSIQNGAGFSGKTRTYWACRNGKSGLSATERAVGKNAGASFAKRKKAVCPEYQIMRGGESRMDSTVNEGRFQRGKGGQDKRASLEKVEGSMSG